MNMKEQQTEYFELQELRVKRGEKQNGSPACGRNPVCTSCDSALW